MPRLWECCSVEINGGRMSFDVFTAQNKPPPQSSSNSQAERIAFLIFVLILVLNSTWAFVSTLPCMIRLPKLHRGEICLDCQTRKKFSLPWRGGVLNSVAMKRSMYTGRNTSWFDCINTHVKQISQSPCYLRIFSASKTLVAWLLFVSRCSAPLFKIQP